jgi:hypothetical protein
MARGPASRSVSCVLLMCAGACGPTSVTTSGVRASRKWVGPTIPGPLGGQSQTTIYYGPWQCSGAWMEYCQGTCTAKGRKLMGCIWLADIKTDWQSRFLGYPMSAGGRLAITHCCCDYPLVQNIKTRRAIWERETPRFRKQWSEEFGAWPTESDGRNWHGHHIRDLARGGDPTAPGNVLPTPPEIHYEFTDAYPACYGGSSGWNLVGPDRPYVD